ncbi:AbrB family transcriptional regulator [Defluviimonas sp. WL0002]|uniref:AbrB family transcriptional regulator n=1 Tax=Albidovulum marisflavi TaxID=2984159 RepID=A0ABT2Z8I3_9RHOB|nr:AbrB family transcriptional regulator [Defluviimonas sp. WL0002]MCV2867454.1 AbrB family transcriptional regulator [Defluviimonas sp. WL0002]
MSFLRETQPFVTTLVAGAAGAALAALAGIPAGALIGSTLAVVAVSALKFRVGLPNSLRDLAFATIGVSLGSGVDERLIGQIGTWGISLAVLMLSLIATLLVGRLILAQFFGMDKQTATLASSPGTMSNAIAIAVEGHGDATAVMFLQLTRLLVLVIAVPPLATMLGDAPTAGAVGAAEVTLPVLALLLAAAILLGRIGGHLGLPAASLLAGMVISAGGHAAGLIHGTAPGWITFVAFALTGAVLGTRMSLVTLQQTKRFAVAGLAVVGGAILCSLAFAALTSAMTNLSFGQVWIAYAPGGVEAMAAIGLSLGYDPAYVAVHHFARIFALVVIVPVVLKLADR